MDPDAAQRHHSKVERIAAQVRNIDGKRPVSLRKRAVAHQVPKPGDRRRRDPKIDVSDLTEVLHVDPDRRLCVAESGVTFVDLVRATLPHGLVPIVVPELKTITVGGAVAGCSIESMSFVHGGFHDTCVEYELITGRGEVLRCGPEGQLSLVFQMLHGTFGTLGILTELTFRLVPAKPFVRLRHDSFSTFEAYREAILAHARDRDVDFMDGIIHGPQHCVLCLGFFEDEAPYTSRYDWLGVYYQSTARRSEDFMTTVDYFFRYDRGVTNVRPRSWVGRLLFGRFMASSEWLRIADKLHWLLPRDRPTITLDVFIPESKAVEFMTWYQKEFDFFPLWCVPYRRVRDYEWLTPEYYRKVGSDELFIDLAIYGMRQRGDTNYHRLMEEKLAEIGGIKTLIAHNYYGEDEFWRTWNRDNYQKVKAITDPDNRFRDLFDKMCRAAMGLPDT